MFNPVYKWISAVFFGAALSSSPVFGGDALLQTDPPQGPAKVRFAADFPVLTDSQWGFQIGGFGGINRFLRTRHAPVIFIHGNNVDHADWYPVRDAFLSAGWSEQELWALSYNGLGGNGQMITTSNPERDAEHTELGYDGKSRITNNDVNVPDLYEFIKAVQRYTRSRKIHLVSHSLGVTLARKTLQVHPELGKDVVSFVGIAGANHGTSLCPPGSEGVQNSCDEIAANTPWLADLNGINGEKETYGKTQWMTIYDGSGVGDPAYAGPTYAKSPQLNGAVNLEYPLTYHNDLRLEPQIINTYRTFIENTERGIRYTPGVYSGNAGELHQAFVMRTVSSLTGF